MNISTVNDKMYMTYDKYNRQPMQSIELKLNMNFAKKPRLIISLERFQNYTLIREYSHIDKVENQNLIKLISLILYLDN